jgi:hypothetical protein
MTAGPLPHGPSSMKNDECEDGTFEEIPPVWGQSVW